MTRMTPEWSYHWAFFCWPESCLDSFYFSSTGILLSGSWSTTYNEPFVDGWFLFRKYSIKKTRIILEKANATIPLFYRSTPGKSHFILQIFKLWVDCTMCNIISKNDWRNSGGTLRQKLNLIEIWHLIFDIWHLNIWTFEHLNIWTFEHLNI